MDKNVSELSIDEIIRNIGIMYDAHSWNELGLKLQEAYEQQIADMPIDNKHKIKQLKQQARYSKNPMEVKKLNQEIMKLQREINKERIVK